MKSNVGHDDENVLELLRDFESVMGNDEARRKFEETTSVNEAIVLFEKEHLIE